MRDGPLRASSDDDRLPLQTLGSVDRGKRDAAGHGGMLGGGSPIEVVDQVGEITTLGALRRVTQRLEDNPSGFLLGREKIQEFTP